MNSLLSTRLYWRDAYLRTFEAAVRDQTTVNGQPAVALDVSAFYPTGGGQPHDTGLLNNVAVTEVAADDDAVWHLLETRLPAGPVRGQIDWPRRYDHMQQHTGQHLLSQAFIVTCAAETIGFHLGVESTTIDLNQANLSQADLDAAEALANQVIAETVKYFGDKVYTTRIPRNVRLSEAPSHGQPIQTYAPTSPGGRAYTALSEEIIRRDDAEIMTPATPARAPEVTHA